MPSPSALSIHQVIYLNALVVTEFKKEFKKRTSRNFSYDHESQLYGFSTSKAKSKAIDYGTHNIFKYLTEHQNVKTLIENNKGFSDGQLDSKHLHKKYNEAVTAHFENESRRKGKAEDVELPFSKIHLTYYLKYLNLTREEFEKSFEQSFNIFIGLYLSFFTFSIKNFILKISNFEFNNGQRIAIQHGFHSHPNEADDEIYDGIAHLEDGWMSINLWGKKHGKRMNMMGEVGTGNQPIASRQFINVSIQAVTMGAKPRSLCMEAVLWRTSHEKLVTYEANDSSQGPLDLSKIEDQERFRQVCFYLSIHRNIFAFLACHEETPSKFLVRQRPVRDFTSLAGHYRIWNFSFRRHQVVQSRFEICQDGRAILFPFIPDASDSEDSMNKNEKRELMREQKALINISQVHEDSIKVVVMTFAKPGLSVVNVSMFDMPKSEFDVIEGVYATLEYDARGGIVGYMVMQKVKLKPGQDPAKVIEPMPMNKELAKKYAKDNGLLPFYATLYKSLQNHKWRPTKKSEGEDKFVWDLVKNHTPRQ